VLFLVKKKVPVLGQAGILVSNPFAGLEIGGLADSPPPLESNEADAGGDGENGVAAGKGEVILRRETAHRGGRTVVVVHGFHPEISGRQIAEYCKKIKQNSGCGGKVDGRVLEIQGEMVERLRDFFQKEGFRVRGG